MKFLCFFYLQNFFVLLIATSFSLQTFASMNFISNEEKERLKNMHLSGDHIPAEKHNLTEFVCSRFAPPMFSDIDKIVNNLMLGKDPGKIEGSLTPVNYLERTPQAENQSKGECNEAVLKIPKTSQNNIDQLEDLASELEDQPNICKTSQGEVDFKKLKEACGGIEIVKIDKQLASTCESVMILEENVPDAGIPSAVETFKKLYPKYAARSDAKEIAKRLHRKTPYDNFAFLGLKTAQLPEMISSSAKNIENLRSGQCKVMVSACQAQCAKKDSHCLARPDDFYAINKALDYFEKYLNAKSINAEKELSFTARHHRVLYGQAVPNPRNKQSGIIESKEPDYIYLKLIETLRVEMPELSSLRQAQDPNGNPYPLLVGLRPQNFSDSQALDIITDMRKMRKDGSIPDSERVEFAKTEIAMLQDYTERIELLGGKSNDTVICKAGWFLTRSNNVVANTARKGLCNNGPENLLEESYIRSIVKDFSVDDVQKYLAESNQRPDGPKNLVLQKALSQSFEEKIRTYLATPGIDPEKAENLLYSLGAFQGDFSRAQALLKEPRTQMSLNALQSIGKKNEYTAIKERLESSQKDKLNNISVWQLKAAKQEAYQDQLNHRLTREFTLTNLAINGLPDEGVSQFFISTSVAHMGFLAGTCAAVNEASCALLAVDAGGDAVIYGAAKYLENRDPEKIKKVDAAYTTRASIAEDSSRPLSEADRYYLEGAKFLRGEKPNQLSEPSVGVAATTAAVIKQADYKVKAVVVAAQKYAKMDLERSGGLLIHAAKGTSQYQMINKARTAVGIRILSVLKTGL